MFSAKFIFLNIRSVLSKLLSKNQLQTLDISYRAQPFVNIVSASQETNNLDTVYRGQPFYGHSDGYSINN